MTKEEAIKKHREMWMKLAENGKNEKPGLDIVHDCYLCAYNNQDCDNCLLVWPEITYYKSGFCPCTRSYFSAWANLKNTIGKRKKFALKIANLKERE